MQKFLDLGREQATLIVNNLMTARLQQFEHIITTELPLLADEFGLDEQARQTLHTYIEGLQNWMAGILDWHHLTGRYDEPALQQRYPQPEPQFDRADGLGTSARRLATLLTTADRMPRVG
ncbi:MAG TPA: hypothetical protein VHH34_11235 [Pseudonocardiaceae bacterium]|nr:hypothetical protein [Pseudonocardiaceae bacterium]